MVSTVLGKIILYAGREGGFVKRENEDASIIICSKNKSEDYLTIWAIGYLKMHYRKNRYFDGQYFVLFRNK